MKTLAALSFLFPMLILPGCVNLTKPEAVKSCSSKNPSTCVNNPQPSPDAAVKDTGSQVPPQDTASPAEDVPFTQTDTSITSPKPDTAIPDTQTSTKPDAPIDTPPGKTDTTPPTPDTPPAKLDTKPSTPDTTPPTPDTKPLTPDTTPLTPDTSPPTPDTSPPTPDTAPPSPFNCPTFKVTSGGQSIMGDATTAFCIVTCDDLTGSAVGWNCSNMDGTAANTSRTMKINGTTIECGKTPIPPKVAGYSYNVFEVGPGKYNYASIYWWGQKDNKTCDVPASGP